MEEKGDLHLKLTRKVKYLYIDGDIIKDEHCVSFFNELSHLNIPILLYLTDIMEKEKYEDYEGFAYVSDILYGYTMDIAIQADVTKKGITEKNILVVSSQACEKENHIVIEEHSSFQNLKTYMDDMRKEMRIIRTGVSTLFAICVIACSICIFNYDETFFSYDIAGIIFSLCILGVMFCMCIAYYYRLWKVSHMIIQFLDNIT